MAENSRDLSNKNSPSGNDTATNRPLKLMTETQQVAVLLGVVKLLRGICPSVKPDDGVITEDDGKLNMLGQFWRSSLGEFQLKDFGAWREALETRKVETPDWFPPVRDIWSQIVLARDLAQGSTKLAAPPPILQLPSETGMDHLRARTTGDKPAYGPMKAEWAKAAGEPSQDYGDRMMRECEQIMPGLKALRKLRELREQEKANSNQEKTDANA